MDGYTNAFEIPDQYGPPGVAPPAEVAPPAPFGDVDPWTHNDTVALQQVQNEIAAVRKEATDRTLSREEAAGQVARLAAERDPMLARQQAWTATEQARQTHMMMQQQAAEVARAMVNHQTWAEGFPSMVGHVVNPDTGQVAQFAPDLKGGVQQVKWDQPEDPALKDAEGLEEPPPPPATAETAQQRSDRLTSAVTESNKSLNALYAEIGNYHPDYLAAYQRHEALTAEREQAYRAANPTATPEGRTQPRLSPTPGEPGAIYDGTPQGGFQPTVHQKQLQAAAKARGRIPTWVLEQAERDAQAQLGGAPRAALEPSPEVQQKWLQTAYAYARGIRNPVQHDAAVRANISRQETAWRRDDLHQLDAQTKAARDERVQQGRLQLEAQKQADRREMQAIRHPTLDNLRGVAIEHGVTVNHMADMVKKEEGDLAKSDEKVPTDYTSDTGEKITIQPGHTWAEMPPHERAAEAQRRVAGRLAGILGVTGAARPAAAPAEAPAAPAAAPAPVQSARIPASQLPPAVVSHYKQVTEGKEAPGSKAAPGPSVQATKAAAAMTAEDKAKAAEAKARELGGRGATEHEPPKPQPRVRTMRGPGFFGMDVPNPAAAPNELQALIDEAVRKAQERK
jgi:hypothetical protein